MRGFFIFLVFICKVSIWEMIQREHPKIAKLISMPIKSLQRLKPNKKLTQNSTNQARNNLIRTDNNDRETNL
jgi:hypothetical protein